jgi:hypothetical protein
LPSRTLPQMQCRKAKTQSMTKPFRYVTFCSLYVANSKLIH